VGSSVVRANCPFSDWLHEQKNPTELSFAVKLTQGSEGNPKYCCSICNKRGTLLTLLEDLQRISGTDYRKATELLSNALSLTEDTSTRKRIMVTESEYNRVIGRKKEQNNAISLEIISKYPLLSNARGKGNSRVRKWLVERYGIPLQLIAQYRLRLFTDDALGYHGVIFPIYDLTGMKIHDIWLQPTEEGRSFSLSASLIKSPIERRPQRFWFGNQFFDPTRPLVLVEEAIDVLKLRSFGIVNVWGCGSQGPTVAQFSEISAKSIFFGFNADVEGRGYTREAIGKAKTPQRYILDWKVVGKNRPVELEELKQFRKVFDSRIKITKS
jgi:hypothetical protein